MNKNMLLLSLCLVGVQRKSYADAPSSAATSHPTSSQQDLGNDQAGKKYWIDYLKGPRLSPLIRDAMTYVEWNLKISLLFALLENSGLLSEGSLSLAQEAKNVILVLGVLGILTPLTQNDRNLVLNMINTMDPKLYELMIAHDPTGKDHIVRDFFKDQVCMSGNNVAVTFSHSDGLPVIHVGSDFFELPAKQQYFILGHELGHYALGHLMSDTSPHHPILVGSAQKSQLPVKVKASLDFKKSFDLASQRQNEWEADRFSILHFKTGIDAAISYFKNNGTSSWLKRLLLKISDKQQNEFSVDHPSNTLRIKNLNSLKSEVALQKDRGTEPTPIDWQKHARDYLELLHYNQECQKQDIELQKKLEECRKKMDSLKEWLNQVSH